MSFAHANSRPEIDLTRTLPAGYYTDPQYFEREIEKIHLRMWLFAGREEDIPNPGSYVTRQVANARVLLVRGDDGAINAFHNVCRHRGTLLCTEGAGQLSGSLQCKYHAWTYRLDGTLRKAPHMEKVVGFREEDWPLLKVHVANWDGNLFINLSDDPIPFEQHLNGMERTFKNWRMHELKTVERRVYHLEANWKLIIQNYHECLHCPIVHPQLNRLTPFMSGDNEPPRPTWLGAKMDLLPGFQTLTMSGQSSRKPLPGLTAEDARHVYYYALLPNMLINPHPDYVISFMFNPIAVNHTEITCHWLMHPDEIAKPGFDPSDAIDFWHLTNQQDWHLSDLAQRGISARGYRSGPFSNREELLIALDKWIIEKVGPL